jgi:hypothetical protein
MADEKRLLVPIDGSNHSLPALAHVIKRAASDGQIQLFVFNVQLPLPPSLFVKRSMVADHNKTKKQGGSGPGSADAGSKRREGRNHGSSR